MTTTEISWIVYAAAFVAVIAYLWPTKKRPFSGPWPLTPDEQLYEQSADENDDIYWLRVIAMNTAITARRTTAIAAMIFGVILYFVIKSYG